MRKQSLTLYRQKRDFTKTAEPSGERRVLDSAERRFVVQKHAATRLHFDLRLELDGVFKSWAVTRGPSTDPADKRLAVEVEDHPLDYGDFEGTIPEGQYGGGTVQLWDRGFWRPEGNKTPEQALQSGDLKFTLEGTHLHGSWVLVRMKQDRDGGKRTNWLLIKHRDAQSVTGGGGALAALDRSVASGRSMKQIAAGSGRAPKPFMLAPDAAVAPDAIWNSTGGAQRTPAPSASGARLRAAAKSPRTAAASKGQSVEKIPDFVSPQLAKLVDRPPNTAGWGHEVKFDGYRAELRVVKHQATFRTRSGLDWTHRFSALAQDARSLPDCLIDGEVVALDARRVPSFSALQAALSEDKSEALVFFAFDLLFENKQDLRTLPLTDRKARLERLLASASQRIRYVEHFESRADTVLLSACRMELEGIVSKRLDAPYAGGRSDAWLKSKCRTGHEVVLGGWTTEGGTLRSLLAGVNRDGHLVYVGRIGTGYGREIAANLVKRLKPLTRDKSPFGGSNAPKKETNVRWLDPTLVAEIEFAGWTGTGMIRQAAFKGLREDKPAHLVVAETPTPIGAAETPDASLADAGTAAAHDAPRTRAPDSGAAHTASRPKPRSATPRHAAPPGRAIGRSATPAAPAVIMGVPISKPDKPLWPDAGDGRPVTKLDLARYFEAVGSWMVPHLRGRPCSLVRAPDGVAGQQFFQRHAMAGMSNLFELVKVKGDRAPYVQIDRIEALAAVAQIGALEIHPWNCAPNQPDIAGRLVFDLDPAPDVPFTAVIEAALEIRQRLQRIRLESFCKTTGGKGLHVVTPLDVRSKHAVEWPMAKNFAHIVCAQMVADAPDKYLDTMSKSQRVGRIFLDYLRNDRTATAVAPLSPRARAGAPVSMPLEWPDVTRKLDPLKYTVRSAPAILQKSKAWTGYDDAAGSLREAIAKVTATPDAKNAARKAAKRTSPRAKKRPT